MAPVSLHTWRMCYTMFPFQNGSHQNSSTTAGQNTLLPSEGQSLVFTRLGEVISDFVANWKQGPAATNNCRCCRRGRAVQHWGSCWNVGWRLRLSWCEFRGQLVKLTGLSSAQIGQIPQKPETCRADESHFIKRYLPYIQKSNKLSRMRYCAFN